LDAAAPEYQKRDEYTRLATAMRQTARALEALAQIESKREGIEKGRAYVENREKEYRSAREELQAILEQIRTLKASMPDERLVYEWENRYAQAATAENNHLQALEQLKRSQERLSEARTSLSMAVANRNERATQILGELYDGDPVAALDRIASEETKRLRELEKKAGLGAYVELLREGEPCPLCGSPHHPRPAPPSLQSEIVAARKRIEELERNQKDLRDLQMRIHKAEVEVQSRERENEEKTTAAERTRQEYENIRQTLNNAPFSTTQIGQQKQKIQEIKSKIKQLEDKEPECERLIRKCESDLERAKQKLADYEKEKERMAGQYEAERAKVSHDEFEAWKNLSPTELVNRAEQAERRRKEAETAYENAQKALQDAESRLVEAGAAQSAAAQALQNAENEWKNARRKLESVLSELNMTEDAARQTLTGKHDVSAIENLIREFESAAAVAADKYRSALAEVQDLPPFDPQALDQARQNRDRAAREYESIVQNVGALHKTLRDLQEKIETKRRLEQEKKEAELYKSRLDRLEKLFRGSGFVQYVATYYMHELCRLANERFRVFTSNHYEILYDEESGGLIVRDYLHSGETRSIKTLSGGQTFQAALCLALALTTMTAGGKRDFFFLDEGFGTLDGEALALVIEALRGLRNENCTVGVISHVERLREEIGAALLVENHPVLGSVVTVKA
ncbi:MAG: SMC family ATPase, partial [Bacteroidia bacterium]|nr:SMC family ATPase [Bacteroidia bacterium]